ncbi:MAG: aldehyde dehydrogenase family protein [Phycisphaeraceae bacterium]|nr:aldehyde dehydrogenase family protein [Phycisphaeraceae bacterium]
MAWVRGFRAAIARNVEPLLEAMHDEAHKARWEAFTADILPLLAACAWTERNAKRLLGPQRVRGGAWWSIGQTHHIERVPIGRIGIIATWNYPVQLLGVQLVHALAAGNRVVVKPSERAPRTQALLLELARTAGLPDGTLDALPATREAGAAMLQHEEMDHLVFTGSTTVGRRIAEAAARRLLPTTLELSGRDTAFVLADGDIALAARTIWNAVTMNAGQTCMAPRRVLVGSRVYARFLDALAPLAAGARPRRLIDSDAAAACFECARGAVAAGGRSLSGVLESPRGDALVPVAVVDCPADTALFRGEHFGPAVAVVPFNGMDDAIRLHALGAGTQQLATSIFTRGRAAPKELLSALACSTITINDCILPTADPRATIGGVGQSGWGVSRGAAGLLAMTRPVHIAGTSRRVRLPIDTPIPSVASRLMRACLWTYGAGSSRAGVAAPNSINGSDT